MVKVVPLWVYFAVRLYVFFCGGSVCSEVREGRAEINIKWVYYPLRQRKNQTPKPTAIKRYSG